MSRLRMERASLEWQDLYDAVVKERDDLKSKLLKAQLDIVKVVAERDQLRDTPGGKRIYGALNHIAKLTEALREAVRALEKSERLDDPWVGNCLDKLRAQFPELFEGEK